MRRIGIRIDGSIWAEVRSHMCVDRNGKVVCAVPVRHVRRCMFVWFRPADHDSTLPQWCTDAAGRCHGVSIPPPLIRPELIHDLRLTARALLAPQIADLVACAREPILSAVYDLESPRLTFGRVALLGDAAFVSRPHVGTGVTKAALDAQALVDALVAVGGDVGKALAAYECERIQFGMRLVARGRYLGSHLDSRASPRRGDDRPRARPPIETLLSEYGAGSVAEWPSVRVEQS
jgi:2-polyprenyl-6-methoxyphenol hydroxylase-like FAD-dependent oxidoreductase